MEEDKFAQYEQAIEFLRTERDTIEKEFIKLKAQYQHALDQNGRMHSYIINFNENTKFQSPPCPFCSYVNGVFIYACGLHREIERLENEITKSKGLPNRGDNVSK